MKPCLKLRSLSPPLRPMNKQCSMEMVTKSMSDFAVLFMFACEGVMEHTPFETTNTATRLGRGRPQAHD
jgi:hypothetical protein